MGNSTSGATATGSLRLYESKGDQTLYETDDHQVTFSKIPSNNEFSHVIGGGSALDKDSELDDRLHHRHTHLVLEVKFDMTTGEFSPTEDMVGAARQHTGGAVLVIKRKQRDDGEWKKTVNVPMYLHSAEFEAEAPYKAKLVYKGYLPKCFKVKDANLDVSYDFNVASDIVIPIP